MGVRVGVWEPEPPGSGGLGPVALHSRHVAQAHFGPGAAAGDDAQAESLEAAARALGGRPVLLPTSDASLLLLSRQRARLRAHFRFLLPPHALLEALLDKRQLRDLAARGGVAVPRTLAVEEVGELRRAAAELGYPCLLKSACGLGDAGKVIARDWWELAAAFRRLTGLGAALMLQEFLPGDATQVALYNAYFNAAGEPVAVFTGRKLRQWPAAFGTAARSQACAMPGLAPPLTAWLRGLGYTGAVDIGLKWDARQRTYKLLDVNPRLGQNFRTYVARGRERADLGWLAYGELAGRPLPAPTRWPLEARARLWHIEDNDWRSRRAARLGWTAALRETLTWWTSAHEGAYWDWRDPGPLLSRLRRRPAPTAARACKTRPRSWRRLWEGLL